MSDWNQLRRMAAVVKQQYPPKTRIELNHMEEKDNLVPPGMRGSVVGVDAVGTILMQWDNGATRVLIPNVDSFRTLTPEEVAEEQRLKQVEEQELKQAEHQGLKQAEEPVLSM